MEQITHGAPLAIADIKFLKINGLLSTTDLTEYLRPNFKGLVLDLSGAIIEGNMIPNSAFLSSTTLTSINIPEITEIGQEAFWGCVSLSSISMPRVTTIKRIAFAACTALTEISFDELTSTNNLDKTAFTSSGIRTIKVYNSTPYFIQTFNDWLDINFPPATAIVAYK